MARSSSIRDAVNKRKQDLILGKAIDLFHERGFTGTSMDMIASELGVTKPFLYYRYSSKLDLLADIFAHAENSELAVVKEQIGLTATPAMKLRTVVRHLVSVVVDNWKLIAVYYGQAGHLSDRRLEKRRKLRSEWQRDLVNILEEGRRRGVFSFGDADVTVHSMVGSILWGYHWISEYGPERSEFLKTELTRAALAMVGCSED